MATDNALISVYRNRIGEPTTDDEAYGYWLFVFGIVLGIVGLLLFYLTASRSTPRQFGYLLGAIGLILLFAGPTIRLPLTRRGLILTYLGAVVGLAAIVWFTTFYPSSWAGPEGNPAVTLYIVGLGLMAVGAVVSPLLTGRKEAYEEAVRTAQEATVLAEQSARDADQASRDADRASEEAHQQTQAAEQATRERDTLAEELASSETARGEMETVTAATEAELAAAHATIAAAMDSKATFELYEDSGGKFRWRLRHRNSNIIADSAQGYSSRQKAMQGLRSVQSNAAGGAVVFFEDATEDDAAEDVPVVPAPESDAAFELFEDSAGEFRWRLRHDNGNILADSGEGYASKSNVRRALKSVRAHVPGAAYLEVDPVAYEVYTDAAGEFRWRLLHRNGNILADSGEGYSSRSNARRAARRVSELAPESEVDDGIEVYEDKGNEWRWRLRAANGELVADSGEGYTNRSKAMDAVERLQSHAADAHLLEIGSAAFEVYEDKGNEWRWRLRHRNGEIIADSGEGYTERNKAVAAIERVKRHAPGATEDG
ncbi:DUF1508 domain-containing protein [Haloarcula sp. 1CSR25-25]|uniref:DUF1508 domain-containing protein n=1 Tax=Haloarcula sp. 1CSR25-25 TaxID=2862545 RepID=UPI0028941770|nr:DUF1508 domain-containing protein [Haloarcula sp. 1CSR25-25]MDT3434096.1 DUF1508 domain-containing protein [Haloarcula sp. 1CSR25-25]